jgi:hypothetical protein
LKGVTDFFLRAKHWQIFVLVWGTYFVGQMAIASSLPTTTGPFENPLKVGLFSEAVMVPFVVCLMGWLWSMGSFLFLIVKPTLKLNIGFFRFALTYSTLYLLTALPFFLSRNPAVEAVILPMHLLALFCLIHVLYFVSKSLVIAEQGKTVTFGDYALSLLLLSLSPIGVWLIQPRINRFYAERGARHFARVMPD